MRSASHDQVLQSYFQVLQSKFRVLLCSSQVTSICICSDFLVTRVTGCWQLSGWPAGTNSRLHKMGLPSHRHYRPNNHGWYVYTPCLMSCEPVALHAFNMHSHFIPGLNTNKHVRCIVTSPGLSVTPSSCYSVHTITAVQTWKYRRTTALCECS